ncbi:MAG TPA: alternative ribosome rescue aminoacyl-tRNA hydrolase ArfB [Hyphomonadaceae bacterium]|nr:alternative ribosome rescue aminoacyl-tRNA hydrolase ArfB [Hyphomonadaceae bacterium]HPN06935.1 alternative ribosome rescue aminoacyl-tRNA hydrolase ArfB [Hyphomonadaceae bacterium]
MKVFLHQFEHELEEKFVTAGGPGGQNVNKVASAVQIRWNVKKSHAFDDEQKWMIRRALANRINDEGELVLFIQTHRSQVRNREEARERLVELIEKSLVKQKKRVATKPSKAQKQRRLEGKAIRSKVKANRGRISDD